MANATTATTPRGTDKTPAQLYALLFGATLLLVGLLGFFVDSNFDFGNGIGGDDLIVFEVNGTHNVVHIASGLLGLALAGAPAGARAYALGFGAVYLLVAIIGFVDGEDVLGLIPVNTEDNFLHLAIALTGIAAGLASRPVTHTRSAV
ncbi:MAG: DUF4383 domain-containing protein [Actinomycetota bacterium]|nr:DUF4383 domain-containing protein [Actinomycetota bacterium]